MGYLYSSTAPTGSGDPYTSQVGIKDTMLPEFRRATFAVDLTAQGAPLQADPDDVQKVSDHLRHTFKVTLMTLFSDDKSTKDVSRNGFRVSRSYEPLTHLLNIVSHAANICLTRAYCLEDLHLDLMVSRCEK